MKPLLLLILLLDTSPKNKPYNFKAEDLGANWTGGTAAQFQGIQIYNYRNNHLDRDEVWYAAPNNEWFIQVRKDVFVLGVMNADQTWSTNPRVQLRLHRGKWVRVPQLK